MGITFSWPPGATPIDPDEAAALIPAIQTQSELNEFEAQNILSAISWAQRSRVIRAKLLEPSTLKTLHRKMFGQTWKWAGTYRTSQKNIGCEAWQIGTKLVSLRDDVKVWLEFQSYPPDEIAARFHHQLVWIHPFPNGNGRFARFATDLLSEQRVWKVPTWGSSDLGRAGEVRSAYIEALRAADRHDLDPLIRFLRS